MRALLLSFLFIGGAILSVIVSPAYADTSSEAWVDKQIGILGKGRILQSLAPVCNGDSGAVKVIANGFFENACVLGEPDGVRIARFYSGAAYLYAVAFPNDEQFYELRGACELWGCAYSSQTDTLVTYENISPWQYGGVVYKNFKAHLKLTYDTSKASPYFRFTRPDTPSYALWMGSYRPSVGAVAISPNGNWALFEIKSYGIVRLDLQTMKARRVIAQTGSYGNGYDPVYELAISDNGKYVVATGRNVATLLTSVNDTCGDVPVEGIGITYASTVVPCKFASINTYSLFPNTSFISSPRFDSSGERLGLTANYANGTAERVIIGDQAHSSNLGYLALGDSFTSGEGELSDTYYTQHSNEDPIRCHLSARSYPYILGSSWNTMTKSVACSGARSVDVAGGASYKGQGDSLLKVEMAQNESVKETALQMFKPGIIAQSNFVSEYQPRYISLSIGGNDAGLVGRLTACVSPGTCEWAKDPSKRKATAKEIAAIYTPLKNSIQKIKSTSPQSTLFMVGYPQVMSRDSAAKCDTLTGTFLDASERIFIWESVHYLNQIVKAVATSEGLPFVDIEKSFEGHELCGSFDSAAMNSIRLGDDIAPIKFLSKFYILGAESFHPTPVGHEKVASTIKTIFPTISSISNAACPENCPGGEAPQPSSYWNDTQVSNIAPRQHEDRLISNDIVSAGTSLLISVKDFLFQPLSKVSVELHSDPIKLADGSSDEEGLFQQSISVPKNTPSGYHTLHLFGVSPANEQIDVYKTIAVINEDESKELTSSLLPSDTSQVRQPLHVSSGNTLLTSHTSPFESNVPSSMRVLGENVYSSKPQLSRPHNDTISLALAIILCGGVLSGVIIGAVFLWRKHIKTSHKLKGG